MPNKSVSIGSVMTFCLNKILIAFTTTATAVFGAYFKLQSFIFMPIFGLNNGMVPIIAYNYGAQHRKRMIKVIRGISAREMYLSSKVLSICFENFFVQTQFFFMGVVLGSLPMIYKEGTSEKKFKPIHIIPFLIGLGIIIGVTVISMSTTSSSITTELDGGTFVFLLVSCVIAAAAMIMPGLSGSLVLLILGGYHTVITAVSDMNIPILIPAAIGILIGVVLCAKLITLCLKKWKKYRFFYSLFLMI